MGGADVKEEGVETEDGAGNPAGNTPIPHNTGVGVSTRRTTYVMVSDRKLVVSSVSVHLLFLLFWWCIYLIHSVHTFFHRRHHLLKIRPHYPTCLPQLLHLNLHDPPSLGPKVESLATGPAHPSVPGGSVRPLPSKRQQLRLLQQSQQHHHHPSRVLLWTRRDLRAPMVLNWATGRVVWGPVIS